MKKPRPQERARPAQQIFRHCPRCGGALQPMGRRASRCAACRHEHFFTPVAAVGTIVADERGRVLLIRRRRDPGRGLLGLPGGFVDPGETAERAARREAREEVGIGLRGLAYFCSFPNRYTYRGMSFPVLDIFFTARATAADRPATSNEVDAFVWLEPRKIRMDRIVFPSIRRALERYRRLTRSGDTPHTGVAAGNRGEAL